MRTQIIDTEDLIVAAGEVNSYDQGDFIFATALMIGWYEAIVGEEYYEPSVINRGEMHLGTTTSGDSSLIRFAGSLAWDTGVFENYGLVSAVASDDLGVRALFAPSRTPSIFNAGTIRAEAISDAIVYESWAVESEVTNTVSATMSAAAARRSIGLYLPNGGQIANDGTIIAHVTGSGGSFPPETARAVLLGFGNLIVNSRIANSGLIQASDANPVLDDAVAIYLSGVGPITILNSGTIRGDYAVQQRADSPYAENYSITIENDGLIAGNVLLGFGSDAVENNGRIIGDVQLGGQDDEFGGELGTFVGLLDGGDGSDILKAGRGAAQLLGGAGADVLDGGAGADQLDGGAGADRFVYDAVPDSAGTATDTILNFESGIDKIDLRAAGAGGVSWIVSGGQSLVTVETLAGTMTISIDGLVKRSDFLLTPGLMIGTAANDSLTGSPDHDRLFGRDGADRLRGTRGSDLLDGGEGPDRMEGGAADDDYIVDNALDTAIEASADGGLDTVHSAVTFTLRAYVENLVLTGTGAVNATGNGRANVLTGNMAANILNGGGAADTMHGGAGNDTYVVDNPLDRAIEISASHGVDLVKSSVAFTLGARVDNLSLTGTAKIEGTGNQGANTIVGNDGDNRLNGLGGNDVLRGGRGADTLDGGAGNDILKGWIGADRFLFDGAFGSSNVDTLLDFTRGSDRLVLDNSVFKTLPLGALAPHQLAIGTAAADANDRILYDPATGTLYYDRDGTGAAAPVQFAILDNQPANLTSSDFLVI